MVNDLHDEAMGLFALLIDVSPCTQLPLCVLRCPAGCAGMHGIHGGWDRARVLGSRQMRESQHKHHSCTFGELCAQSATRQKVHRGASAAQVDKGIDRGTLARL